MNSLLRCYQEEEEEKKKKMMMILCCGSDNITRKLTVNSSSDHIGSALKVSRSTPFSCNQNK